MINTFNSFLKRNIPALADSIEVSFEEGKKDYFEIEYNNSRLHIKANNVISACHGLYEYLKRYCNVQLSWCSNTEININELVPFDGILSKTIEQKYRVYMNYCTLDYSMCWWDFDRWEKEIDFMAMNGINMPLAVVGSEAVWYEWLIDLGFTETEAISTISGPAFWSWQLMTNIEGYLPPRDKKYVYERYELGKKILDRYIEFGMYPIQQGFSGFVPMLFKDKFPNEKIIEQKGWCTYPKTAQLDPLDPFFKKIGTAYLNKMDELFGNHHFIACDPFHEGVPPKNTKEYLSAVGRAIDDMYKSFDKDSIWVMQAWTPQEHIIRAVPKDRLLLLDLDSDRANDKNNYLWGYDIVCGMLHNFGAKNAMQGKLKKHAKNNYLRLKNAGAKVVGSGMFMEGIEQNPVIYDLQFKMLTESGEVDFDMWLDNYLIRRYSKPSSVIKDAWSLLLETCYKSGGYEENRVGSCLASRPQLMPIMTGPCCYSKVFYDIDKFEKAVKLFASVSDEFKNVDAYQYDLCDMLRQAMSNRFYSNQLDYKNKYQELARSIDSLKDIAKSQLELLLDLDELLSYRSEMTLSRWINASHKLATDKKEKEYFDFHARTQITLWGDINTTTTQLFDYAWKEWSGLIKEYYYPRWQIFYRETIASAEKHMRPRLVNKNPWLQRSTYKKYRIGKLIDTFEMKWINSYKDYPEPQSKDVTDISNRLINKWNIG